MSSNLPCGKSIGDRLSGFDVLKLKQSERKKLAIALVVLFLVLGGSVFTSLAFNALNGLGVKQSSFTYSFASRGAGAVVPMFQYFGAEENAGSMTASARKTEADMFKQVQANISDWMEPAGSADGDVAAIDPPPTVIPAASLASASAAIPRATQIPRLSGTSGGTISGGGGGSQTSGSVSKFSGGDGAGTMGVAGGRGGQSGVQAQGRGTAFGALAGARTALAMGMNSGSAATARYQGDRSYTGVDKGGGSRESFSNAPGGKLLDTIKTGVPDSLKESPNATTLPSANPVSDSKMIGSKNYKDMTGQNGEDAMKKSLMEALGQMAKGGGGGGGEDKKEDKAKEDTEKASGDSKDSAKSSASRSSNHTVNDKEVTQPTAKHIETIKDFANSNPDKTKATVWPDTNVPKIEYLNGADPTNTVPDNVTFVPGENADPIKTTGTGPTGEAVKKKYDEDHDIVDNMPSDI